MGRASRSMSSMLQKNPKRVKEMLAPCQAIYSIWSPDLEAINSCSTKIKRGHVAALQVFSPQNRHAFSASCTGARATRDCVSRMKSSDLARCRRLPFCPGLSQIPPQFSAATWRREEKLGAWDGTQNSEQFLDRVTHSVIDQLITTFGKNKNISIHLYSPVFLP